MKVTEEMRYCPWFTGDSKTTALKDYSWVRAEDNKTMRKIRYCEANLLKESLEAEYCHGLIKHPELGTVYASPY
jgi:hypothetical protein